MMDGLVVHLELFYLLSRIAILGEVVDTHPTGPSIDSGHRERDNLRHFVLCTVGLWSLCAKGYY